MNSYLFCNENEFHYREIGGDEKINRVERLLNYIENDYVELESKSIQISYQLILKRMYFVRRNAVEDHTNYDIIKSTPNTYQ